MSLRWTSNTIYSARSISARCGSVRHERVLRPNNARSISHKICMDALQPTACTSERPHFRRVGPSFVTWNNPRHQLQVRAGKMQYESVLSTTRLKTITVFKYTSPLEACRGRVKSSRTSSFAFIFYGRPLNLQPGESDVYNTRLAARTHSLRIGKMHTTVRRIIHSTGIYYNSRDLWEN